MGLWRCNSLVTDILTSSITSGGLLVGGGVIGFAVGYPLKKIAKA